MLQICGSLSGLLFACPDRCHSLRYYSKKRLSVSGRQGKALFILAGLLLFICAQAGKYHRVGAARLCTWLIMPFNEGNDFFYALRRAGEHRNT